MDKLFNKLLIISFILKINNFAYFRNNRRIYGVLLNMMSKALHKFLEIIHNAILQKINRKRR